MNQLNEIVPFKTSIFSTVIDANTTEIISNIRTLKENLDSDGKRISNTGGWQSKSVGWETHIWMRDFIDKNIVPYVIQVYQHMSIAGQMSTFSYWFNINKKFNYNIAHAHGGSYLSGVFYFKVPKNSGDIFFMRPDNIALFIPFKDFNPLNGSSYAHKPKPNELIIFPSHLYHSVDQNLSDEDDDERISMAFNCK